MPVALESICRRRQSVQGGQIEEALSVGVWALCTCYTRIIGPKCNSDNVRCEGGNLCHSIVSYVRPSSLNHEALLDVVPVRFDAVVLIEIRHHNHKESVLAIGGSHGFHQHWFP